MEGDRCLARTSHHAVRGDGPASERHRRRDPAAPERGRAIHVDGAPRLPVGDEDRLSIRRPGRIEVLADEVLVGAFGRDADPGPHAVPVQGAGHVVLIQVGEGGHGQPPDVAAGDIHHPDDPVDEALPRVGLARSEFPLAEGDPLPVRRHRQPLEIRAAPLVLQLRKQPFGVVRQVVRVEVRDPRSAVGQQPPLEHESRAGQRLHARGAGRVGATAVGWFPPSIALAAEPPVPPEPSPLPLAPAPPSAPPGNVVVQPASKASDSKTPDMPGRSMPRHFTATALGLGDGQTAQLLVHIGRGILGHGFSGAARRGAERSRKSFPRSRPSSNWSPACRQLLRADNVLQSSVGLVKRPSHLRLWRNVFDLDSDRPAAGRRSTSHGRGPRYRRLLRTWEGRML